MPVVSESQYVSLHTVGGTQLYQFGPEDMTEMSWAREQRQTSRCTMGTTNGFDYVKLPRLMPWVHWLSVWSDRQELYWTGPLQNVRINHTAILFKAADMSVYFDKTRNPFKKRWDAADPADIADEYIRHVIEAQGLSTRPVVRPDPRGIHTDFTSEKDVGMTSTVIGDLVERGLRWSVVAGVPRLGPMPLESVTALGEHNFVDGQLELSRDGAAMANDILLRGADNIVQHRVPRGGLNLQSIVDVDSIFGVSNAQAAVREWARHTSQIRDAVTLPGGSVLRRDAPVTIDELIPSARFNIAAFDLLTQMELQTVEVTQGSDGTKVAITMEAVDDDPPELAEFADTGSQT